MYIYYQSAFYKYNPAARGMRFEYMRGIVEKKAIQDIYVNKKTNIDIDAILIDALCTISPAARAAANGMSSNSIVECTNILGYSFLECVCNGDYAIKHTVFIDY